MDWIDNKIWVQKIRIVSNRSSNFFPGENFGLSLLKHGSLSFDQSRIFHVGSIKTNITSRCMVNVGLNFDLNCFTDRFNTVRHVVGNKLIQLMTTKIILFGFVHDHELNVEFWAVFSLVFLDFFRHTAFWLHFFIENFNFCLSAIFFFGEFSKNGFFNFKI